MAYRHDPRGAERTDAPAARPMVGMIVPPAAGAVPPEPPALYPDLDFIATGLALDRMTPHGYDTVIGKVEAAARALADRGADVISLMGTSLSFYRGPAFNDELIAVMERATGLPASTMSTAVADALRALGGRRIAVATAYGEEVNARLAAYLEACGFAVLALVSLDIERVEDVLQVTDSDLVAIGRRAVAAAPAAEALFISCGGLQTLNVTVPLEEECRLPVVSSAMAGAWGAARLAGHSGRVEGFGRLFSR